MSKQFIKVVTNIILMASESVYTEYESVHKAFNETDRVGG